MTTTKGFIHFAILIAIALAIIILFLSSSSYFSTLSDEAVESSIDSATKIASPTIVATPTPYQFPYKNPTIAKARSYRTIIVGDSIVETLGINANVLREKLISYYPDSEFVNYNYGFGSTSILSLPDRLVKTTRHNSKDYTPILSQGFEFIIIESFAYNPLSQFPLDEGLQKQNEMLEESVKLILESKPGAALAFMTPIAPSEEDFGRGIVDLSQEQRSYWVKERIAYIKNHIDFANEKGIPVIDVYHASLTENGVVDNKFIANDKIHPSEEGIKLISQEIADYIFENRIFPN